MRRAGNISAPARKRATRVEEGDSRARILRVALERFARYGYDGVSLQQIADDVGLHKSSLFHHYASKPALLRAVLEGVLSGIMQHVRPLQSSDPPSAETLLAVLRAVGDHFCDEPQAARMLLSLMTAPDDSELRLTAPGGMEFYEAVVVYLDRARRANVIGRINIRQAIPNLVGLVLAYPAVVHDLAELVGRDPFSARARQTRAQDLERTVRALLQIP